MQTACKPRGDRIRVQVERGSFVVYPDRLMTGISRSFKSRLTTLGLVTTISPTNPRSTSSPSCLDRAHLLR